MKFTIILLSFIASLEYFNNTCLNKKVVLNKGKFINSYHSCLEGYVDDPTAINSMINPYINYFLDSTTIIIHIDEAGFVDFSFRDNFMDTTFLRVQDRICIQDAIIGSMYFPKRKAVNYSLFIPAKLLFDYGELIDVILIDNSGEIVIQ